MTGIEVLTKARILWSGISYFQRITYTIFEEKFMIIDMYPVI